MPHTIHANGVDHCVETFGEPGDPAIVLIHGGGNCMLAWADGLCERLAAGGRFVVRYDCRDAGRTRASAPYSLADLAADAVGLLNALGIDRAHFAGMSLGGMVAQLLAIDHPERVASITLVSSTPGGGGLPGMSAELRAFYADEPPAPDWTDRDAVIEYLVESERPFAGRSFDEAAARERAARVFEHGFRTEMLELELGEPLRARLPEIAAPALIVHGTDDPLFPLEHGRALAREIPAAELLEVEGGGHEYPPADVLAPALLRHTAHPRRGIGR